MIGQLQQGVSRGREVTAAASVKWQTQNNGKKEETNAMLSKFHTR